MNKLLCRAGLALAFAFTLIAALPATSTAQIEKTEVRFGPATMVPANEQGIIAILIGLLLPAVEENSRQITKVSILTPDAKLELPFAGGPERKGFNYELTVEWDAKTRMYTIAATNTRTKKVTKVQSKTSDLSISIVFDSNDNGLLLPAVKSSVTVRGVHQFKLGDGSVLPLPFEYALPGLESKAPS